MKLKYKIFIKDLELQIDWLIGYTPQGLHWKNEYWFRKNMIDATLADERTNPETRDKINRIQDAIWRMRNKDKPTQAYLSPEEEKDFIIDHEIKVNDKRNNLSYLI